MQGRRGDLQVVAVAVVERDRNCSRRETHPRVEGRRCTAETHDVAEPARACNCRSNPSLPARSTPRPVASGPGDTA